MAYTSQTFTDGDVLYAAALTAMDKAIVANQSGLNGLTGYATDTDGAYRIVMYKKGTTITPIWVPEELPYYSFSGTAGIVSPKNVYSRKYLYALANLQGGAIHDGKLFVGDANGTVYIKDAATGTAIQTMALDNKDTLKPHSNAVTISTRDDGCYLYTNIYSNYKSEDDKHIGECCVYSMTEDGGTWTNTLTQVIKVGFIDDTDYWPASTEERPYGNFIVDDDNNFLYAYVLSTALNKIQWHKFALPAVTAGITSDTYGCPVYTLTTSEILSSWTTPYTQYIQDGCVHDGLIYQVAGADGPWGSAQMQVIDPAQQTVVATFSFHTDGNAVEPELITFDGDTCYYSNIKNMYQLGLY